MFACKLERVTLTSEIVFLWPWPSCARLASANLAREEAQCLPLNEQKWKGMECNSSEEIRCKGFGAEVCASSVQSLCWRSTCFLCKRFEVTLPLVGFHCFVVILQVRHVLFRVHPVWMNRMGKCSNDDFLVALPTPSVGALTYFFPLFLPSPIIPPHANTKERLGKRKIRRQRLFFLYYRYKENIFCTVIYLFWAPVFVNAPRGASAKFAGQPPLFFSFFENIISCVTVRRIA